MKTRSLLAILILASALPLAHVGAFGYSLADLNFAIEPNGDQEPDLPAEPDEPVPDSPAEPDVPGEGQFTSEILAGHVL